VEIRSFLDNPKWVAHERNTTRPFTLSVAAPSRK